MDSIRSLCGVSVAHLMVLSSMVPVVADVDEGESDYRRMHGRRHAQVLSHSREDYPVVTNWLTSPDTPEIAKSAKQV